MVFFINLGRFIKIHYHEPSMFLRILKEFLCLIF